MRTTWALFRRELAVYFVSPMAYIILTCLMVMFGFFFWFSAQKALASSSPFLFAEALSPIAYFMVFIAPIVTMRLVAEEKNRGTFETLMTAPVTELQVVLAKYAATLAFLLFLLLPTVAHAILVSKYGTLDVSESISGYIGVFLATASLFAIGLFVSSVCTNQVTAGVITFVIIIMLAGSALIAPFINPSTALGCAARPCRSSPRSIPTGACRNSCEDHRRGPSCISEPDRLFPLSRPSARWNPFEVAMNPFRKRRILAWLNVSVMTVLMAAFLIGVNLLAHSRFARIDMTTDKVWEISAQSRQILKGLNRDLEIYINAISEGPMEQEKALPEAWRRTVLLLGEMTNQNPGSRSSRSWKGPSPRPWRSSCRRSAGPKAT
jgi:ABC-2 type transport system permease protein